MHVISLTLIIDRKKSFKKKQTYIYGLAFLVFWNLFQETSTKSPNIPKKKMNKIKKKHSNIELGLNEWLAQKRYALSKVKSKGV